MNSKEKEDLISVPITGTLDLHGFQPSEIKGLVIEYLFQCQQKGIYNGRIIHGKGMGTLRETVHSILKRHKQIKDFGLSASDAGGWGSTSFTLTTKNEY